MTSSPSFPFPIPLQTHSSPLTSLNMFRWGIWVIDFGSSLEALTHKLGIWNILLCLRKGNAAKLPKSTKNLQGLSSLGAELKNFFWLSLQNLSQVLLLMKFHSQSNRNHTCLTSALKRHDDQIFHSLNFKKWLFSH